MNNSCRIADVVEDASIKRHEIPNRLTSVERRLMKFFRENQTLVTCVGNIGAGKKLFGYIAGIALEKKCG